MHVLDGITVKGLKSTIYNSCSYFAWVSFRRVPLIIVATNTLRMAELKIYLRYCHAYFKVRATINDICPTTTRVCLVAISGDAI